MHGRGSLDALRHDRLLLERLRVPLLELGDQLRLLIIDSLLSELSLLLQLLQLFVRLAVLLLELFELAELLQLLLIDDLGLVVAVHSIESISVRCESWVHLLGQCISRLFLILAVQEALDLIDLLLDRIDLLRLSSKLHTLGLHGLAALDNLCLDLSSDLCALELTEGCLLVDSGTSLSIRILLFSHASQHSILLLLLDELILDFLLLLPLLHRGNFCLLLF